MLIDLLKKARSYRRFDQAFPVNEELLRGFVDNIRFANSGVNHQPFKYRLVYKKEEVDTLFPLTKWAGALKNYGGPELHERPTGFIVICFDKDIASNIDFYMKDVGIVAEVIMLSAVEKDYGGCMINSFSRPECQKILGIADNMEPMLLVALGKPSEEIILEEVESGVPVAYYRDENGVHHVPKRMLKDILL